ncbi:MAG: DNA polymerase domain-containing protein, partial [Candidatus Binataceae bacterium]
MSTYQEILREFHRSRLLFGDPSDQCVVAVELASSNEVEVFRRVGADLVRERRPVRLFALVEAPSLLNGFAANYEVRALDGDFPFRHLVTFGSLDALDAAKKHLRETTGRAPNAPDAPYLVLSDPVEQHLMLSGSTYFMGMEFAALRRLQTDIETYISPGFEFPSAA